MLRTERCAKVYSASKSTLRIMCISGTVLGKQQCIICLRNVRHCANYDVEMCSR